MFAHGFNVRFGSIEPPADVDVTMVRSGPLTGRTAITTEKLAAKQQTSLWA